MVMVFTAFVQMLAFKYNFKYSYNSNVELYLFCLLLLLSLEMDNIVLSALLATQIINYLLQPVIYGGLTFCLSVTFVKEPF